MTTTIDYNEYILPDMAIFQVEEDDDIEVLLMKSGDIRKNLNVVLHKKAGTLQEAAGQMMNIDKKWFRMMKDFQYYRGGYPSENSPARIDAFVDNIANIAILSDIVGYTELTDKLAALDIHLTVGPKAKMQPGTWKNTKSLDSITNEPPRTMAGKISQFWKWMKEACELQSEICKKADVIKITHADAVEKQMSMQKSDYRDCVDFQWKHEANRKIDTSLEKYKETVFSKNAADDVITNIVLVDSEKAA